LVIYPALAYFWRENFLSSHDNAMCIAAGRGGGRVHRFLTHRQHLLLTTLPTREDILPWWI
jgi:hypothetical protein